MRPFFTYFGGKYRAAPKYPAPAHATVIEPFAGAAGYSLRHYARNVILCEKNDEIRAMWKWLIAASERDVLALPLMPFSCPVSSLNLPLGARTLIGFWMNKGTTHPGQRPSAWASKYPEQFWGPEVRQRVAEQVSLIKHWQVLSDFSEAPDIPATWFVDPPYQGQGHRYREHALDYAALAQWCSKRKGQVIVCEQEGATWAPFEPLMEAKSRKGKSREVMWHFGS